MSRRVPEDWERNPPKERIPKGMTIAQYECEKGKAVVEAQEAMSVEKRLADWDWQGYVGNGRIPRTELVFGGKEGTRLEDKQRFFLFLTQVRTVDIADSKIKPFPISWLYLRNLAIKLLYVPLLVVFKSRQMVVTWLVAALALWKAMDKPNRIIVVISKRDKESKELVQRITQIYQRLPEKWKKSKNGIAHPLTHEIEFKNGSLIKSYPPTVGSGKSITATDVIIDEGGEMRKLRELIGGLQPALGTHGKLCVIGTLRRNTLIIGAEFWRLVQEARRRETAWQIHELHWRDMPGRDDNWAKEMKSRMEKEDWDCEFDKIPILIEGLTFPSYDEGVHVIDELPITFISRTQDPQRATPVYMAIDPHVTKPCVCLWAAKCSDGNLYVIEELKFSVSSEKGTVERLAERIKMIERDWRIINRVIDPFSQMKIKLLGNDPIRKALEKQGIICNIARRHREGLLLIQNMLQVREGKAELYILRRCSMLRREMREYSETEDNKVAQGGKMHCIDCLKYIVNEHPRYFIGETEEVNPRPVDAYGKELREQLLGNLKKAGNPRKGSVWI